MARPVRDLAAFGIAAGVGSGSGACGLPGVGSGPMIPLRRPRPSPVRRVRSGAGRQAWLVAWFAIVMAFVGAGCGTISRTPAPATPAPFPGIAGQLSIHGIKVSGIVSGDAGCPDANLAKTAIGFDAVGLDQATPVRLHIYIFRNRDTYQRLQASVDGCAAAFVTNRDTYESVATSPYVVAGQGPWGTAFKDSIRAAIVEAAGTGD